MTKPLAATREDVKKASDTVSFALDLAEEALGPQAVLRLLLHRYPDSLDYLADEPATLNRDDLDVVARLVHEGHDPFLPEHCEREVCRHIAELGGTRD